MPSLYLAWSLKICNPTNVKLLQENICDAGCTWTGRARCTQHSFKWQTYKVDWLYMLVFFQMPFFIRFVNEQSSLPFTKIKDVKSGDGKMKKDNCKKNLVTLNIKCQAFIWNKTHIVLFYFCISLFGEAHHKGLGPNVSTR